MPFEPSQQPLHKIDLVRLLSNRMLLPWVGDELHLYSSPLQSSVHLPGLRDSDALILLPVEDERGCPCLLYIRNGRRFEVWRRVFVCMNVEVVVVHARDIVLALI